MNELLAFLMIPFMGGNMLSSEDIVQPITDSSNIEIIIIYDNNPFNDQLKTAWGFSCLIRGLEKTILFDTGGDGEILMSNMKKLNINPADIDLIFLSHEHWDHIGGLEDFLENNHNVVVYLLPSFPTSVKSSFKNAGAEVVEIVSPASLCEKASSTGKLGTEIDEQSLIIETKNGLVIITGCAHPGIVNIVQYAKKILDQKIYMVFGGFHLGGTTDSGLKSIIKQFRKMEVKKAGPCHCSGDRCRELFADEYKENFIDIGVGKIIEFE